jgi:hypothetical protein
VTGSDSDLPARGRPPGRGRGTVTVRVWLGRGTPGPRSPPSPRTTSLAPDLSSEIGDQYHSSDSERPRAHWQAHWQADKGARLVLGACGPHNPRGHPGPLTEARLSGWVRVTVGAPQSSTTVTARNGPGRPGPMTPLTTAARSLALATPSPLKNDAKAAH